MNILWRTFWAWLPLAITIVGLCMLVYATVQQNFRQSLNDPQIQMAEDAAQVLAQGGQPASVVPPGVIDIGKSLAPWIGVYTNSFEPLETNGTLYGKQPMPPKGVFEAAKEGLPAMVGHHLATDIPPNENRISWQPNCGIGTFANECVRQALVIVAVTRASSTMYVVAGRNMREVEEREGRLSQMTFLTMFVLLAATLVAVFLKKLFS
jgi:heme exporter protein D